MSENRITSALRGLSLKRRLPLVAGVLLGLLLVGATVLVKPFWRLTSQLDDLAYRQPSRLYARPLRLVAGESASAYRLIGDLRAEGYREGGSAGLPLAAGRYRCDKAGITVHLRSFPALAESGGGNVEARFSARTRSTPGNQDKSVGFPRRSGRSNPVKIKRP